MKRNLFRQTAKKRHALYRKRIKIIVNEFMDITTLHLVSRKPISVYAKTMRFTSTAAAMQSFIIK